MIQQKRSADAGIGHGESAVLQYAVDDADVESTEP
jgi:hypothetical protein